MLRLISPTLVLVALLGLAAGYFGVLYYKCRADFAEYKADVAQDAARASANTVKIVQAITRNYEVQLRKKRKLDKRLEAEYNRAMVLIHTEGKKDATYRKWAAGKLPPGVVSRLRALPEIRSEN